MKRILISVAVVLMSTASVTAQIEPKAPQPVLVADECVLSTTAEDWTAIGLTAAQVADVQAIQTQCKTDCIALKETGGSDPAMGKGMLEKHRSHIQAVLTAEQYEKWLVWCSTRPSHG